MQVFLLKCILLVIGSAVRQYDDDVCDVTAVPGPTVEHVVADVAQGLSGVRAPRPVR